jgi:hypothetical protein
MGGKSKLPSVNEVLENIENLDIKDQVYISEVLSKRLIELRRTEIAERAREAEQAYRGGKVKKGGIDDLWKDLGPE